jgi:hypothetical protein
MCLTHYVMLCVSPIMSCYVFHPCYLHLTAHLHQPLLLNTCTYFNNSDCIYVILCVSPMLLTPHSTLTPTSYTKQLQLLSRYTCTYLFYLLVCHAAQHLPAHIFLFHSCSRTHKLWELFADPARSKDLSRLPGCCANTCLGSEFSPLVS